MLGLGRYSESIWFPVREEMNNWYEKILTTNMVSRTGRLKKRVREDIEGENGFSYWKKLNTGTGSRTGRNEKRVREDIESGYGFPYWKNEILVRVPLREEIKNRYGKILRADMVSRTGRN